MYILYSELLTFLGPKRSFSQEMAKNKENVFCNLILEFFPQFKSAWSLIRIHFQNWIRICIKSVRVRHTRALGINGLQISVISMTARTRYLHFNYNAECETDAKILILSANYSKESFPVVSTYKASFIARI
jgi:hypothetical protein